MTKPGGDDVRRIEVPGIHSLQWRGDDPVDWVGGGRVVRLDGTTKDRTARASYPETYDGAYSQWLQLQAKGNAPICVTSVIEGAHL